MSFKLLDGAKILNYLINKYKRVYVHCMAGVFRSVEIVIIYYTIYKKYKLDNAIKYVESKHPIAVNNRNYMANVLSLIYQNELVSKE